MGKVCAVIVIVCQFMLLKPAMLDLKEGAHQFKSCRSNHKTPILLLLVSE